MGNGLNIDCSNFEELTQSQKLTILFNNTEQMKNSLKSWKIQIKIQWWWLGALTLIISALAGVKYAF